MRINLPGNKKIKIIVLIILICISLGILVKEKSDNIKKVKQYKDNTVKEEIIKDTTIKSSKSLNDEKLDKEYNKAYKEFFEKKYQDAINTADSIIKIDNKYYKAYNIRGISKAYKGNYDSGLKDVNKSLELNSNYGYAIFNKALIYELYGKYDEALNWYNKDLKIENYVWSYYGISSIYGRRGDVDKTIKYLKKAIELDSRVKDIAKNEEDFNPVKNSNEFKKLVN